MILYFSGTGNSRLVALKLSSLLNEEAIRLEYPFLHEIRTIPSEKIIWVFPVYSWGIPPVVERIIEDFNISEDVTHFMVCTCGDDVGLTAERWRRLIKKKGWRGIGTWSVQMPNTYVLLPGFNVDSKPVEESKLMSATTRIEQVARGIRHSARVDDVVKGSCAWLKSKVLNPLFVKFMMSPKPFYSNEKCTGCGLCSKKCPMRNITLDNKKPIWGKRCALCLECYHCCPVLAVQYGKITKAKGQYQAPSELKD
ncbi:MAG: EFR1 family ferrodoxin [Paramuribaculum sp.]|nr:EFR1 family ferrodoxin [Paramuribaculum sp.]